MVKMLLTVLVICGYAFDLSHEANIISLPFLSSANSSVTSLNKTTLNDGSSHSDYVKLQPGTKIYFYTTEDENVVIGPKLQSEEDISILFLNQDDDFKKFSQFKNSYIKPDIYSVLKSGVLVPQEKKHKDNFTHEECNRNVYQSLKPTYYVKGFKNILIPVDVLYTKTNQDKMFKSLNSTTLFEPDSWRTDLKMSRLKKNKPEPEKLKNSTWSSVWKGEKSRQPVQNAIRDLEKSSRYHSPDDTRPDKTCDGEITLFLLKNNGVFTRVPSDPFLPSGLPMSYSLLRNLLFKPEFSSDSNRFLIYTTGKNGDLIPHASNFHKIIAENGSSVSFMLSKNGGLFPVEERKEDDSISYYFNGRLVHKSRQFTETFSNSTSILVNNKKIRIFEAIGEPLDLENDSLESKNDTKVHHVQKRSVRFANHYSNPRGMDPGTMRQSLRDPRMDYQPPEPRYHSPMGVPPQMEVPPPMGMPSSMGIPPPPPMGVPPQMMPEPDRKTSEIMQVPPQAFNYPPRNSYPISAETFDPEPEPPQDEPVCANPPLRPRTDIFIFDEKGTRIRLIPQITDTNDVVIYKLTCKGNLVRYPSCKEPEFNFEIHFQLLLDEFVLVPTGFQNKPFLLTYVLQENGDLIPAEGNTNTFRKAPGSLIYYMLGKNNVLFPVQQIIDMEGNVSFYYQDFFLLKMKDSTEKPLHFSTKGAPLFAFFNGFTMITISSKPRLNNLRGSNWREFKTSDAIEGPPKTMYLTGPKGEMIKVTPYKNKQGATVVYELDCNGIFYRSPKDKKKCIILKSYILLKEGILLPSNDTSGYVYMMSKNGDLFPYLYPEGKIEAPLASSLKYVLCEKGILLPIKLEIIDNYICYLFNDMVVYKEKVYCKSCLDRLDEQHFWSEKIPKKSSCDIQTKEPASPDANLKLFINDNGDYVFYEKQNKVLRRHPPETVPQYLKYTMGSFEIKPDGSLYQIRYQDPSESVVNLMLEPNGDLLEDTRNVNLVRSQYYVLDDKGNLIAAEVKKTKKNLYFYKNNVRICRVPVPSPESAKAVAPKEKGERTPPLGKDPMDLMKDPYPKSGSTDTRSLYIPIPLKSVSVAEPTEQCTECSDAEQKKNCDVLKDALKQVSKGPAPPLALELELTDEIIEELKNWAAKCDKVLTRREISENLKDYIIKLNHVRDNV